MKCPSCNCEHHAKTDVFGNKKGQASKCDFGGREIFGVTTTCSICLDECSELVALPCGHILCKADYQRMGGFVQSFRNTQNNDDKESHGILINIRKAGQHGVNGTYRKHDGEKSSKYTSMGRYNGNDVEYCIESRENSNNGQKYWYLCCYTGNNPNEPPVDFYKAQVNGICAYPARVRWEPATLNGTFPCPKVSISYFE